MPASLAILAQVASDKGLLVSLESMAYAYSMKQIQEAKGKIDMMRGFRKAERALNSMMVREKPITPKNFCFCKVFR